MKPSTKWAQVIANLQATPGEWIKVAEDAGPSTVQRLRSLGAEVTTDNPRPRTEERNYSRYDVYARWPTPQTELETIELEHSKITQALAEAKADVQAADEEYNSMKRNLNRSAYRRKQARERYEPLLEQHDQLTALLNRLKTEKD